MRILYDHQAFSLQAHGGITRVFTEIIRYLNARSDVVTDIFLGASASKISFASLIASPGRVIQFEQIRLSPGTVNYLLNEALAVLGSPILGRYDIYHSTLYRFVPTVKAQFRVATHHDCVQEKFPHLFKDVNRIRWFKRSMFQRADLILCVSAASRDDLLRFYDVPAKKTVVVHNGVSPMGQYLTADATDRHVIQGEYLLYVGARYAYKNFIGLLKAYARSGLTVDYSLLVVGGGPATISERKLIADLGIEARVKFIPYASQAFLADAYARSKLLVYPSLYEGFGMPPLEAASVGCVSLVASNPAVLEVCQDAVYYFDPAEEEQFPSMLRMAVSDDLGRSERLERAKSLLNRYTWESCGKNTLDAYKSLISST